MKKLILIFIFTICSYANESFSDFYEEFSKKEEVEIYDPLSGYNRVMTNFNDSFYTNFLNPVSTSYS